MVFQKRHVILDNFGDLLANLFKLGTTGNSLL